MHARGEGGGEKNLLAQQNTCSSFFLLSIYDAAASVFLSRLPFFLDLLAASLSESGCLVGVIYPDKYRLTPR